MIAMALRALPCRSRPLALDVTNQCGRCWNCRHLKRDDGADDAS